MFHNLKAWRWAAIAALLLVGCNEANPVESGSTTSIPDTPAKPRAMRHITVDDTAAAAGKKHFGMCVGCHGDVGQGKAGQAPRLAAKSFMAAASDDYLFTTIKDGRAGTTMIPWGSTLKDPDIEAVIVYLRSLEPAPAAELDESPLKGDEKQGEKLFAAICSACHGVNGAGYQETANGTGIGRKGFLDSASDGFIRYMARNGKDGTAMRPMQGARTSVANLTDEEIDSIIKFLRKSAW